MQKTETKNSKAKDVFDKVKTDVRLYKEELNGIERNHGPKERSLGQLKASLESMQTSKEGLESELNQVRLVQMCDFVACKRLGYGASLQKPK